MPTLSSHFFRNDKIHVVAYWSSIVKIFKQQLCCMRRASRKLYIPEYKSIYLQLSNAHVPRLLQFRDIFHGIRGYASRAEQEIVQENAINSPILCCGTFRLPVTRSRISSIYTRCIHTYVYVCRAAWRRNVRVARARSPGIGTKSLQFACPRIDFDQMRTVGWERLSVQLTRFCWRISHVCASPPFLRFCGKPATRGDPFSLSISGWDTSGRCSLKKKLG